MLAVFFANPALVSGRRKNRISSDAQELSSAPLSEEDWTAFFKLELSIEEITMKTTTRFASFLLVATLFVTLFVQPSFAGVDPWPPVKPASPTGLVSGVEPWPPVIQITVLVLRGLFRF